MSAREAVSPLYVLSCDGSDCTAEFTPTCNFDRRSEWGARREAVQAGWTVRPRDGRGSRSAPDLCPACTSVLAEGAL